MKIDNYFKELIKAIDNRQTDSKIKAIMAQYALDCLSDIELEEEAEKLIEQ